MKKIQKITKTEIVVLVIMLSCYIASLYFMINNDRNYALLFFALHGVLTMAYFYISQDRFIQAALDAEENRTEYTDADTEEKNKTIAALRQEKGELDIQVKKLTGDVTDIQKENEELLRKLSEKEIEDSLKNNQEKYNMLLPMNEVAVETDLISVINKVYEKFIEPCRENGIRLELATSFETLNMKCDERYMIVLLSNIIDNSIKYMNRSGSLVITISNIGEEGIFIVCKDNGDGLSPDEVPHIFELNYQGSNRKSGNGLGLAQVKSVVEHYNGTVYAKSSVGEGMAIYIQFPVENKG